MEQNCVLLDTSFFIRLLNEEDDLHENAMGISDILMSLKTSLDKDFINFANKTQR